MRRHTLFIALLFLAFKFSFAQNNTAVPQLGKNKIKEIISAMTLEDKVYLLIGVGNANQKDPILETKQRSLMEQPDEHGLFHV